MLTTEPERPSSRLSHTLEDHVIRTPIKSLGVCMRATNAANAVALIVTGLVSILSGAALGNGGRRLLSTILLSIYAAGFGALLLRCELQPASDHLRATYGFLVRPTPLAPAVRPTFPRAHTARAPGSSHGRADSPSSSSRVTSPGPLPRSAPTSPCAPTSTPRTTPSYSRSTRPSSRGACRASRSHPATGRWSTARGQRATLRVSPPSREPHPPSSDNDHVVGSLAMATSLARRTNGGRRRRASALARGQHSDHAVHRIRQTSAPVRPAAAGSSRQDATAI